LACDLLANDAAAAEPTRIARVLKIRHRHFIVA
jgi:hypothetical protein